jgi:hypothetical protein
VYLDPEIAAVIRVERVADRLPFVMALIARWKRASASTV